MCDTIKPKHKKIELARQVDRLERRVQHLKEWLESERRGKEFWSQECHKMQKNFRHFCIGVFVAFIAMATIEAAMRCFG